MKFLRLLLASTLGTFVALLLAMFVFIGVVTGIIYSIGKSEPVVVKAGTVLVLDIGKAIPDRKTGMGGFGPFGGSLAPAVGLWEIRSALDAAAHDDNIIALELKAGLEAPSLAMTQTLQRYIDDFRQSGKKVYAYGDMVSQGGLVAAALADEVWMFERGYTTFTGLSAQVMFFKGALDKLGVTTNVFYVGDFKSATEPFRRTDMSDANRKQLRSLLGDMKDQIWEYLGERRGLAANDLDAAANQLKIMSAGSAADFGLVDSLGYRDQLDAAISANYDGKIHRLGIGKYLEGRDLLQDDELDQAHIAVVFAEGAITDAPGSDAVDKARFAKVIKELRNDDHVKGVVMRINSPGGSALASDVIWRELKLLAASKPLVASMGTVAASGGYYIAAPASVIFAEPATITGSIGVFGMWPNLTGLFRDKLGITFDTVNTHSYADFGNTMRDLTELEGQRIQEGVDEVYDDFLSVVAEGRKMEKDAVHAIAQGRVWTGKQAVTIGLVDSLGGLDQAIAAVQASIGGDELPLGAYPKVPGPFEEIMALFKDELSARSAMERHETLGPIFRLLKDIQASGGIQARLPWYLEMEGAGMPQ